MRIDPRIVGACLLATACMPAKTRPMELSLDATAALASGDEIGNPVGGGARVGLDWLALVGSMGVAEARLRGVPCGGMVDPADPTCVEQPLEQQSRVVRAGAGYLGSADLGRSRVVFIPYGGAAYVGHEERGLETGGSRDAAAAGWQLGGTVGFQRNVVGDMWLGVVADAALILPIQLACDDCYDPFRESITVGGLSLSASWRLP